MSVVLCRQIDDSDARKSRLDFGFGSPFLIQNPITDGRKEFNVPNYLEPGFSCRLAWRGVAWRGGALVDGRTGNRLLLILFCPLVGTLFGMGPCGVPLFTRDGRVGPL